MKRPKIRKRSVVSELFIVPGALPPNEFALPISEKLKRPILHLKPKLAP
jgi:hypothetical protein